MAVEMQYAVQFLYRGKASSSQADTAILPEAGNSTDSSYEIGRIGMFLHNNMAIFDTVANFTLSNMLASKIFFWMKIILALVY